MRIFLFVPFFAALMSCSFVETERGYPGGNAGRVADNHFLFAKGPQQRVDRFFLAVALLAPLVAETADTPTEAKVSAERLDQMLQDMARLKDAADTCQLSGDGTLLAGTTCPFDDGENRPTELSNIASNFSFETHSFEVSRSLYEATKTVVDNLNLKVRADRLVNLSPTDLFSNILRVRHLIPVAARYFATYRDVTVITGFALTQSCAGQCTEVQNSLGVVVSRPGETNGMSVADQAAPITALFDQIETYINSGGPWGFNDTSAAALMVHVDRACLHLRKMQEISITTTKDCQSSAANSGAGKFLAKYKQTDGSS